MMSESPCKSSLFIFYSSFPVVIVGGDGACQRKRVRPLLKSPRYDLFHDQAPLLVFAYCYGFCDLIALLCVTVYCARGMHESRSDTSSSEINDESRIFVLLIYLTHRADSQSGEGATTEGSVPCVGSCQGDALPHPNFNRTEDSASLHYWLLFLQGINRLASWTLTRGLVRGRFERHVAKHVCFLYMLKLRLFFTLGYAVSVIALVRSIYWILLHGCTNGTNFA